MLSFCIGEVRLGLEVSEWLFFNFRGEKMLISFATFVGLILRLNDFCFRCRFLVFVVTVLPPSDHLEGPSLMVAVGFVVVCGCREFAIVRVGSVGAYDTATPLRL